MPWTAESFAEKHNHKLSGSAASTAARMASAMVRDGMDEGKAIRIANARGDKMMHRADGGTVGFAIGGAPGGGFGGTSPWTERSEAREIDARPGGFINSSIAGRTDRLPLAVASDSHVIDASTVSGVGQGNSLAGANILNHALRSGPWGTSLPQMAHGHGPPSAPHIAPPHVGLAKGGDTGTTSILAAGGEMILRPDEVEEIGRRGIAQGMGRKGESAIMLGHRLIDEMVHRVRAFNMRWLRTAPPPKK